MKNRFLASPVRALGRELGLGFKFRAAKTLLRSCGPLKSKAGEATLSANWALSNSQFFKLFVYKKSKAALSLGIPRQLQNSFARQNRPFGVIFTHSPWPARYPVRDQGRFTCFAFQRFTGPLKSLRSRVKWGVAALLPLVTGLKIIDFSGQSSFTTASSNLLKG